MILSPEETVWTRKRRKSETTSIWRWLYPSGSSDGGAGSPVFSPNLEWRALVGSWGAIQ